MGQPAGAGLVPTRPYLVVALRVKAVVVLTVLVGAVDMATVLTAGEPAERKGGLSPREDSSLPSQGGLCCQSSRENMCPYPGEALLGFRGPEPFVGAWGAEVVCGGEVAEARVSDEACWESQDH